MAVNKRKILDAARKYVQKGAKQKALKEYERLLKLDPRDGKVRLEIGDAHRRWGQVDDAVTQYLKVAEQYKADGFDARAVAVYKQVLNLDPKRHGAQVALSELYQRMGLDAEAIASLQAAADGYHKEGKRREALELLRRMATLDPSNTTSRLKVADLLRQESMNDEAIAEYEAVAEELRRQDNLESVASVYGRILELAPTRSDILVAAGRTWIQLQKPEQAEAMARRAVEQGPEDTDHLELLCDVLKALGRSDELASTTRELARLYRARGDDERARDAMQRLPDVGGLGLDAEEDAAAADEPRIAEPGEGPSLDGDELLGDASGTGLGDEEILDDDFLAADDGFLDGGGAADDASAAPPAPEREAPEPEAPGRPAPEAAVEEPPPAGDPDQLMAEASVYLRYGKRDRAVASLRGVLAQEPEHRGALEKLGEVYAEQGDGGEAVACWTRAARAAAAAGDTQALGVLRDRVAAVDPEAVEALPAPAAPPAAEEPAGDAEGGVELDLDLDVDVEGEGGDAAGAEPDPVLGDDGPLDFEIEPPGGDAADASAAGDDGDAASAADDPGVEIDLDVDGADFADAGSDAPSAGAAGPAGPGADAGFELDLDVDGPDAEADGASASGTAGADDDGGIEIDLDLDGDEGAGEGAAEAAPEPDPAAASRAGASTSQQIAEELEEAEFYFEQGMLEEAEGVYRRVLQRAPQHPSALLRLGEILARRGPAPAAAPDAGARTDASEAPADPGDTAAASEPGEETGGGLDLDLDVEDDAAWEDAPAAATAPEPPPAAPEPAPAETPGVLSTPTLEVEAAPGRSEAPLDETQPLGSTQPAAGGREAAGSPDPGDTFDLAAELRDALEDDEPDPAEQSGSVLSTVEDGFAAIFSEFKKGVSQTLSEGDTETRYDLGIAYREMGLFEDAIGEFRVCLQDPSRRVDSLNMMGLCALDLGRSQDAVNHFEQALAGDGLDQSARAGLHFDLGRALEACGDRERARDAYRVTADFDAGYQDVAERLRALEQGESYESFDDLTGEDEAPEETFESFDDVLTAAELEDDDAEDATDAEPLEAEPVDPEPEPGPADDPGSSGSGRRRRKISFV